MLHQACLGVSAPRRREVLRRLGLQHREALAGRQRCHFCVQRAVEPVRVCRLGVGVGGGLLAAVQRRVVVGVRVRSFPDAACEPPRCGVASMLELRCGDREAEIAVRGGELRSNLLAAPDTFSPSIGGGVCASGVDAGG